MIRKIRNFVGDSIIKMAIRIIYKRWRYDPCASPIYYHNTWYDLDRIYDRVK